MQFCVCDRNLCLFTYVSENPCYTIEIVLVEFQDLKRFHTIFIPTRSLVAIAHVYTSNRSNTANYLLHNDEISNIVERQCVNLIRILSRISKVPSNRLSVPDNFWLFLKITYDTWLPFFVQILSVHIHIYFPIYLNVFQFWPLQMLLCHTTRILAVFILLWLDAFCTLRKSGWLVDRYCGLQ